MNKLLIRICKANNLDISNISIAYSEVCELDDSLNNLQDIETIYTDYIIGCGDEELIKDFEKEFNILNKEMTVRKKALTEKEKFGTLTNEELDEFIKLDELVEVDL